MLEQKPQRSNAEKSRTNGRTIQVLELWFRGNREGVQQDYCKDNCGQFQLHEVGAGICNHDEAVLSMSARHSKVDGA